MNPTNQRSEKIANKIILWGIYFSMLNPLLISPYLLLPDKFAKAVIFRITIEIILIAYIFLILRDKKYLPRFDILTWAVTIFWTAALFSVIFSMQPFTSMWGSATRGSGFFNFTHYIILFFILRGVAQNKNQWQKIFNFAIIAAMLTALFAILQRIFPALNASYMNSIYYRPAGTMGNPIMLANYLAMTVFLAFAFWKQETIRRKKILYFLAGTLMLIAIFISQTRGTFLGLAVSGLFLLMFYPSKKLKFQTKKRLLIPLIIIALIMPFFIFRNNLNILPERFLIFDSSNRLTSWKIAIKAIADKPIFGWGMENFAIPFDKYYPGGYTNSYNNIAETWWDKAHNVPLDIGTTMGLVGLIAYFFVFAAIFQRLRKNPANNNNISMPHIIGAIFIAHFIQNLTAFDSVTSEIMFFTLLAYIYFLSSEKYDSIDNQNNSRIGFARLTKWKKMIFAASAITILMILVRVSLIPFWLNYTSNKTVIIVKQGLYNETMQFYRGITEKYKEKIYFEKELNEKFMKIASYFAPLLLDQTQNREEYLKLNQETINLLKRNIKLEPYHTKHYYNIGLFYSNIAVLNPSAGQEGLSYFTKSLELSPNREQALVESAKLQMIFLDYDGAITKLQKTTAINPELAEPYLWLGIANLYKKNNEIADEYFSTAKKYEYNFEEMNALKLMSGAYADNQRWAKAIPYYIKILEKKPDNIETRALLAGSYQKIGNIKEARREAEILLKIAPQAKESIEAFLKGLK
ncbi:MAG: O-antigen ligase family protein [Patescibacteria group bacterium]